jgi:hypothetical protein
LALAAIPAVCQNFTDVLPSDPYYHVVHLMKEKGITSGCNSNGPLFCPMSTITRGQMAVFIVRGIFWALKGDPESFTYPATPYFTDVPDTHPWFRYIQKIRELNITAGCTATTYCVNEDINYGQLSVFAVRAHEYRHRGKVENILPYTPLPCFCLQVRQHWHSHRLHRRSPAGSMG